MNKPIPRSTWDELKKQIADKTQSTHSTWVVAACQEFLKSMDELEAKMGLSAQGVSHLPEAYRNATLSDGTLKVDELFNSVWHLLPKGLIESYSSAQTEEDRSAVFNEEIMSYLDSIAPEGYSYCAHPDDGACFGFWKLDKDGGLNRHGNQQNGG